jgi:geranylgeranyl pyrophosphate synthase
MTKYWNDLARPTLLSVACEAVGGDPELTTPIAVPMILISGALDIHDDIIDQSEIKDNRPTIYGKFGKNIALLVGDALLSKGLTLLNRAASEDIPKEKMREIMDTMKNMFFELGDAEALELSLRGRTDVTPEEYLRIIQKKAADVEAHTKISGIIGNGTKKEIKALSRYGRLLGMLILLRDDWIDIMDLKELRHRIKKECLPLPLLYALKHPKSYELLRILEKKNITKRDAEKIRDITYELGGIECQKQFMEKLITTALGLLRKVHDKKELKVLLEAMLPYEG